MEQTIPLISLSIPWDKTLDHRKMRIFPEDLFLSEIDHLDHEQDIALTNRDGQFVGWIPYIKVIQTLFSHWKATLSYYHTLLSAVDDAITVVDQHGNIMAWNPKAEEMYQCSSQATKGKPVTDFFKEDSVMLMSALKEGKGVIRKYNQPQPDVHVLVNTLPVFLNDSIIGGVSVERDITDIVRLNDELSTTAAYVHDLKRKIDKNCSNDPFHKIRGSSPAIRKALDLASKVASTDATVLITGESGVGKELFSEAIHKASPRADQPFVDINCGAIPAALFESELFGYEKGAFTGAVKEGKKGKMDAAKGGTLFLDEIGEMPLDLQVKLLRVLQEREFYRVGGNKPIPIDVRIIAATNRNMEERVAEGVFREDLFYRLNVVPIYIPPLRERIEDIPELIQLYLKEFSIRHQKPIPSLDPEVMRTFLHYPWSGNIRHLRNTIERIMILADEEVIKPHHLPECFLKSQTNGQTSLPSTIKPSLRHDDEESKIKHALQITYGNRSAAAKLLNISRVTLYNKMKKYKLE